MPYRRSAVLAVITAVLGIVDAAYTAIALAAIGWDTAGEANPIMRAVMDTIGIGPTLTLRALGAVGGGVVLYRLRRLRIARLSLVLLTAVLVTLTVWHIYGSFVRAGLAQELAAAEHHNLYDTYADEAEARLAAFDAGTVGQGCLDALRGGAGTPWLPLADDPACTPQG